MLPALDSSSLVVIAGVFLAFAALSRRLHGTSLTAPMVFVAAGFALGLEGLGWLHLTLNQESVRALAEATLVVVLFTDASRIDLRALRREYSVPARLLGVGLPLTIVAGALAAGIVLHDVTWAEAAVLAIVLAPTDAALGQAVVTDENLPSRIRQGLNVESGLNDGLCVPLLTIALAIAQTDAGDISASHAARLVVEAIGWGIVGGVIAGGVAAWALLAARARGWIEGHWAQVVPVFGAVGAFGIADARGGSGFIAAFVGGVVYGRIVRPDADAAAFSEELGGVLNGVTLIVFGAAVLGGLWSQIGVAEVVYADPEPHDRAHGAGRDRPARLARPCTDGPVPRLVRPTRARVDRLRRGRRRGGGAAAHLRADGRLDRDRRPQRVRPRCLGRAARPPVRGLVRRVGRADGERASSPPTLASRPARDAVSGPHGPDRADGADRMGDDGAMRSLRPLLAALAVAVAILAASCSSSGGGGSVTLPSGATRPTQAPTTAPAGGGATTAATRDRGADDSAAPHRGPGDGAAPDGGPGDDGGGRRDPGHDHGPGR